MKSNGRQVRAYTAMYGGKRKNKNPKDARVMNCPIINPGVLKLNNKQAKRIRNTTSRVSMGNWVRAHTGVSIESPDRVMPKGVCLATYLGEINSTRR